MVAHDPCSLTGRAFRVHFRAETDVAAGVCTGRIEHLRSGDAAHFSSLEELLWFVASCLARHPSESHPADGRLNRTESV